MLFICGGTDLKAGTASFGNYSKVRNTGFIVWSGTSFPSGTGHMETRRPAKHLLALLFITRCSSKRGNTSIHLPALRKVDRIISV
jgi:hypothetical protein